MERDNFSSSLTVRPEESCAPSGVNMINATIQIDMRFRIIVDSIKLDVEDGGIITLKRVKTSLSRVSALNKPDEMALWCVDGLTQNISLWYPCTNRPLRQYSSLIGDNNIDDNKSVANYRSFSCVNRGKSAII